MKKPSILKVRKILYVIVVGAFPDGQSCLNLAAARLRYIVGTAWSTKCYMNMRPLYQPQLMQTEAVA